MKILRPHFDAALASLPPDLYVDLARREAIWKALVGTATAAQHRQLRWSPEAVALLVPLDRELEALRQHQRSGSIEKRYANIQVNLPRGGNNQPPQPFIVLHVYAQYCQRLQALRERLDRVLRAAGHWCTDADRPELKQPIEVIVANERAQGRPAGTLDWTQWELPNVVSVITKVFDAARIATNAHSKPGRQWAPYVPNTGKAGAADTGRAMGLWRGAFNDAIHEPLAEYRKNKAAAPLVRFYESLKAPATQQRVEDACRMQVKARRKPENQAFRISIWHALDNQTRLQLAAAYDAALRECAEGLSAKGLDASRFSPAVNPNPWAIGDAQATQPIPVVPISSYAAHQPGDDDEPDDDTPLEFPKPATDGPLSDFLKQYE